MLTTSCDDGDLKPQSNSSETGRRISMQVNFNALKAWPQNYVLTLAAFGADQETPLVSKQFAQPEKESDIQTLELSGLPDDAQTIQIALLTKGRKLIYSFYTHTLDDGDEDVMLLAENLSLASYGRIQQQVFNQYCTACHGAGDRAAGSLYLTADKSHAMLVNATAHAAITNKKRVEPAMPSQSFLIEILEEDLLNYNHTDVLPHDELVTLLKTWISNGANND